MTPRTHETKEDLANELPDAYEKMRRSQRRSDAGAIGTWKMSHSEDVKTMMGEGLVHEADGLDASAKPRISNEDSPHEPRSSDAHTPRRLVASSSRRRLRDDTYGD